MVLILFSLLMGSMTVDAFRSIPNSRLCLRRLSLNQPIRQTSLLASSGVDFSYLSDAFEFFKSSSPEIKGVAFAGIPALSLFAAVRAFNIPVNLPLDPAADVVLRAFEEGRGLEAVYATVNRVALLDALLPILQPQDSACYVTIVGENGTGKTTAVKQALLARENPKGAVYFNCPASPAAFSTELASLIEYRPQLDLVGRTRRKAESITRKEKDPDS
jgi:hypothetical protein